MSVAGLPAHGSISVDLDIRLDLFLGGEMFRKPFVEVDGFFVLDVRVAVLLLLVHIGALEPVQLLVNFLSLLLSLLVCLLMGLARAPQPSRHVEVVRLRMHLRTVVYLRIRVAREASPRELRAGTPLLNRLVSRHGTPHYFLLTDCILLRGGRLVIAHPGHGRVGSLDPRLVDVLAHGH